jgi:hypothetical protein
LLGLAAVVGFGGFCRHELVLVIPDERELGKVLLAAAGFLRDAAVGAVGKSLVFKDGDAVVLHTA